MGIHTQAQRALGKARLIERHQPLRPFLPVALLAGSGIAEVAVEIEIAGEQAKAAVFDEAFCLGLRRSLCQAA
ncbi:hypothetical protein D3C81_794290 [compost metagenome]